MMTIASVLPSSNDMMFWVICVVCFYGWLAKKYVTNNPEVGNAAKKAASDKLISLIAKWLK